MGFLVKPIIDLGAPFLKNIGVGLKGMSSKPRITELFILKYFRIESPPKFIKYLMSF